MELLLLLFVVCGLLITAADGNIRVEVESYSDVVLPCSLSSQENIETKLFHWKKDVDMEVFIYDGGLIYGNGHTGQDQQFEGRVSHSGDGLKNGNASIKITKAKVSDSGNYSCDFPRLQPPQMFNIQLIVQCILKDRTAENCSGKCPRLHVTSLQESQYWSLLQCEVSEASPKPKVEWWDSSGKILPAQKTKETERGGSYDIILQTTVTKTDNYSCVVTQEQEDICHHSRKNISIYIHGPEKTPEFPTGLTVTAAVFGLLFFVVLIILLVLLATGRINCKKDEEKRQTNKETESGLLPA